MSKLPSKYNSTISNKKKFFYSKIKQEQNEIEAMKIKKKLMLENNKEKNYDNKLKSLKKYNNKIKNKINQLENIEKDVINKINHSKNLSLKYQKKRNFSADLKHFYRNLNKTQNKLNIKNNSNDFLTERNFNKKTLIKNNKSFNEKNKDKKLFVSISQKNLKNFKKNTKNNNNNNNKI